DDPWPLPCPWFVGPVKPTPKMSFANIRPAAKAVSRGEFPSLAGIAEGGHVEDITDRHPTTVDAAVSLELSAVEVTPSLARQDETKKMAGARELTHVDPDLGDHGLNGGRQTHPRPLPPVDRVEEGRKRGLNAGVEGCDAVPQLLNRP